MMTPQLGSHVFEGSCGTTLLLQTCLKMIFTDGNLNNSLVCPRLS